MPENMKICHNLLTVLTCFRIFANITDAHQHCHHTHSRNQQDNSLHAWPNQQ